MEQKTLNFTIRTERKKGPARRLRRKGQIPSVIYGHNESLSIAIDAHEFDTKFKVISESAIITLLSPEKSIDVLVKDYQEDILRGRIAHIDFYEIEKGKILKARVPVRLRGTAEGVKEGGLIETITHDVEVECLPKDLPEMIEIDVSDLLIGNSIHAGDLPEMEGVRILLAPDQVICTVLMHKEKLAEEEEELEAEELLEGEGEGEGEEEEEESEE